MLRHEFDTACKEINKNYNPAQVSIEMYKKIETVYNWYPTISNAHGKDEIAHLYVTFGFAIIQDMYARAMECSRLSDEIAEHKKMIGMYETKQSQLLTGAAHKVDGDVEWTYNI